MFQIAVMGYGTVGSGVVEVIAKNKASISKKTHADMEVKYILDLRDFEGDPFAGRVVKDFAIIERDPDVAVVVECLGGLHPAYEFVKRSLLAGKSVVTSNKELVAEKGAELLALAREHDAHFMFEASVGGGIPILRPLHQCLAANEVTEIAGILNGTTNFILTKMIREQMPFADALALAQQLGYAERDPTDDIEGHDACRKICILASLAFGRHIYPRQVHTEGITHITLADVAYADAFGGVIKLLGRTHRMEDGRVSMIVSPAIVSRTGQLANVDDVFNGILVRGDAIGDVVFYGRGAGKLPTASAVVADVIDCLKHIGAQRFIYWEDNASPDYVADYREETVRLYLRLHTPDAADTLRRARSLFGGVEELRRLGAPDDEIAFVTPEARESLLIQKAGTLVADGIKLLGSIRVCDY